MIEFPVSGVETYWWLPLLFGFLIASLSSVGGLSGAFLLLPFQMSYLGFTGPAVSPTNLTYNVVSIPSGVWRYWREDRLLWPLAWVTILGTLPGIFAGAVIRIELLPDPASFKPFVALVLLYIAVRLLRDVFRRQSGSSAAVGDGLRNGVRPLELSLRRIAYEFDGRTYAAPTAGVLGLSLVVGVLGGAYGIGGGAIIAPFFVTVFRLPVHTVAGATLLGTLATSIAGIGFYRLLDWWYAGSGATVQADLLLGAMFGLGGAVGMYVGARLQRFLPSRLIKAVLAGLMGIVVWRYLSPLLG
jgi:uncharacterized membrane protein YfcA